MSKVTTLTIIVPVFNEEENLSELISRLDLVRSKLSRAYDMRYLFVNDGSTDTTAEQLRNENEKNQALSFLSLSRNFGHQQALSAALAHARDSDLIALLDGDLQDPPEAIPQMLSKIGTEYDVVFAIRGDRPEGALKRAAYRTFYNLANRLSDVPLPIQSGDFSIFTRRVRREMVNCEEKLRYVRGLRSFVGFKQIGIVVDRGERFAGVPKYTSRKLIGLALDGIFS
ncbi:MAG: glycosyltransferase family 2 protein, partial [Pseudomonadota bacterium]